MSGEATLAIVCRGRDRIGSLHEMTAVILKHRGRIVSVDIVERGERTAGYFEIDAFADEAGFVREMSELDGMDTVERVPTMQRGGWREEKILSARLFYATDAAKSRSSAMPSMRTPPITVWRV